MAEITHLPSGHGLVFEIVKADVGEQSPRERHEFDEFVILVAGSAHIFTSDSEGERSAPCLVTVEAGVLHQVTISSDNAILVVIHDQRG